MEPACNGTARDLNFPLKTGSVSLSLWSSAPLDCKSFPVNTGFRLIKVPFKAGFTVFQGSMKQKNVVVSRCGGSSVKIAGLPYVIILHLVEWIFIHVCIKQNSDVLRNYITNNQKWPTLSKNCNSEWTVFRRITSSHIKLKFQGWMFMWFPRMQ